MTQDKPANHTTSNPPSPEKNRERSAHNGAQTPHAESQCRDCTPPTRISGANSTVFPNRTLKSLGSGLEIECDTHDAASPVLAHRRDANTISTIVFPRQGVRLFLRSIDKHIEDQISVEPSLSLSPSPQLLRQKARSIIAACNMNPNQQKEKTKAQSSPKITNYKPHLRQQSRARSS